MLNYRIKDLFVKKKYFVIHFNNFKMINGIVSRFTKYSLLQLTIQTVWLFNYQVLVSSSHYN